ncbi:hypothetical protein D9619_006205 [Psilocybe cf. subviscida]|uniref:Fungal-type protein kinase domain-containing protein n=1 Tax=Psilocybe cf. subviscida TaxID=2480587 RepID=A0A8H5EXV4_9AGAR|nr:hypothetical protein D9619_006205 [Psilocybe cf. subviscida]
MEPLTPNNQVSFHDSVKPGVLASPHKSRTIDGGIVKQNDLRPNLGLHNNPDMFVCHIESFLRHYGPCDVPQAKIDACMTRMAREANGVLKRSSDGKYSWVDFKILPKDSGIHEDKTFRPLGKIVNAVLAEKTNNLKFLLVPNTELASDIRGSTHKIDACFIDGPYTGPPLQNREIKTPVEVKKYRHKWARAVVHLQILGACHHILNEDPRRMWIYGLTFENTMASVWYFSKSHSVKSAAFNWVEDPRTLVQIFLMFANATPPQLGVDPTVHIGPPGERGVSYVYEVPDEDGTPLFFKTGKSLVPQRPLCISGRTTRVWEVTQVTSADGKKEVNGKKVILKDVWLDASDEHSKTEAENMDAIFKAVDDYVDAALKPEIERELKANPNLSRETLLSDPAAVARLTMQFINRDPRFHAFDDATKKRLRDNLTNKKYRSMFLTKLHAWKGRTCRAVGPGATRTPDLFHPKPLNADDIDKQLEDEFKKDRGFGTENATVHTMNAPDDHSQKANTVDDNYRLFAPKQQSRFIYKEVCTTLQNLDTVGDVIDILCQTVDGLHILFAAGWVHRDISSNNIMAFRFSPTQPWTLKLADLEFSRPMIDKNRKPRADPRTGTPFFMPVEILSRRYLFETYLLATGITANENLADDLGIDKSSKAYLPLTRFSWIPIRRLKFPANADWDKSAERDQGVNHNFQHDLESVWWILLWIVTCRVYCDTSANAVSRMFKHDINDFDGRIVAFKDVTNAIAQSLHGRLKENFAPLVEELREDMLRDYVVRPIAGHLELPESYSNIHAVFATKFRKVQATQGPWRNMKLERRKQESEDEDKSSIPLTFTGKRGRDASDAEPRGSTRKLRI